MSDSEDWLDIGDTGSRALVPLDKPADAGVPGLPVQAIDQATTTLERRAQFLTAWAALTPQQQVFLNTWREQRFNMRAAIRVLANTPLATSKTTVCRWSADPMFELARTTLRAASVEEILNRDNLAARQDDIVETALTPKPILYQGEHTGYEEVEVGVASRANEVLLKLGGHLKDRDLEVNVGIVGPSFQIQVVQPTGNVIDVTPRGVTVELPEPEWVDGA